jgi:hypothetical protein
VIRKQPSPRFPTIKHPTKQQATMSVPIVFGFYRQDILVKVIFLLVTSFCFGITLSLLIRSVAFVNPAARVAAQAAPLVATTLLGQTVDWRVLFLVIGHYSGWSYVERTVGDPEKNYQIRLKEEQQARAELERQLCRQQQAYDHLQSMSKTPGICVVCFESADQACLPCGHVCFCEDCLDVLEQSRTRRASGADVPTTATGEACPKCFGNVEPVQRLFYG